VAVVANVDAHAHVDPARWTELLAAQLCSPVRWRASLHTLSDLGITRFVELGFGSTLTGLAKRTLPGCQALAVSSPDDLDRLVADLGAAPPPDAPGPQSGEHLHTSERLVVSPAAGVLELQRREQGSPVATGDVLGTVSGTEVRSPFTGLLMRLLAVDGERVLARQPVAWLRVA
jgi:[acyl-carrier-protein] S-malonyltransferase